jgi:hypothetical protein
MAQPSSSTSADTQKGGVFKPKPTAELSSPLQSPLTNLRARNSHFVGDHEHQDDSDSGSEAELLLDPNLPSDYSQRHQSLPRHSLSTIDDTTTHQKPPSLDGEDDILLQNLGLAEEEDDDDDKPVEDSPYPEVRAAVHPYDDHTLPCNTLRAWTIGLSLIFLGASMNTLFSLRSPSISLGALIAQVIAWPLGHGWARFVPEREIGFRVPFLRGKRVGLELNPGPFNVKEHAVIVVMASVSFSVAYATDIILAQKVFYKQDFGLLWQLMLTVSTQSLGYGIAGMMRRFLGEPLFVLVFYSDGPLTCPQSTLPR